jgi:hypothetical protein
MDLAENNLTIDDAVMLTGPAGSITLHHARIVHGSALNTSEFDRRLLFYEMMAADAFPLIGSMARFDDLDEYKSQICPDSSTLRSACRFHNRKNTDRSMKFRRRRSPARSRVQNEQSVL